MKRREGSIVSRRFCDRAGALYQLVLALSKLFKHTLLTELAHHSLQLAAAAMKLQDSNLHPMQCMVRLKIPEKCHQLFLHRLGGVAIWKNI